MSIAITVTLLATTLGFAYLSFAYYAEAKWAEDEVRALQETMDAMRSNGSLHPSTYNRRSETLILRKR